MLRANTKLLSETSRIKLLKKTPMYFHVQNYSSHWHIAPREIAVDATIITEKRFLVQVRVGGNLTKTYVEVVFSISLRFSPKVLVTTCPRGVLGFKMGIYPPYPHVRRKRRLIWGGSLDRKKG